MALFSLLTSFEKTRPFVSSSAAAMACEQERKNLPRSFGERFDDQQGSSRMGIKAAMNPDLRFMAEAIAFQAFTSFSSKWVRVRPSAMSGK
jgi:hypothetical protein